MSRTLFATVVIYEPYNQAKEALFNSVLPTVEQTMQSNTVLTVSFIVTLAASTREKLGEALGWGGDEDSLRGVWAGLVRELCQFSPEDLTEAFKDGTPIHELVASWSSEVFNVPGTGPWRNLLRGDLDHDAYRRTCSCCGVHRNPLTDALFEPIPGRDEEGYYCSNECAGESIAPWQGENFDAKNYWRNNAHEDRRCEHCGLLARGESWHEGHSNFSPNGQLRLDARMFIDGDDCPSIDDSGPLDGHAERERPFCTPKCALAWLADHHEELHRVQPQDIPEGARELFVCGNDAPEGYMAAYGPNGSTLFLELFHEGGWAGGLIWSSESWPTYYATVGGLRTALFREQHRLSPQNAGREQVGPWYLPDNHDVAEAIADWYRKYFPRR